jgi:hypothetical protein
MGDADGGDGFQNGLQAGPFVPVARKGARGGTFDDLAQHTNAEPGTPAHSAEGWVAFVSNLDPSTTEEDIKDFFSEFGKIHVAKRLVNARTCQCQGSAVVEYLDYNAACAAVAKGNGVPFVNDRPVHIAFAFVVPSAENQADDVPQRMQPVRRERDQVGDFDLSALRDEKRKVRQDDE